MEELNHGVKGVNTQGVKEFFLLSLHLRRLLVKYTLSTFYKLTQAVKTQAGYKAGTGYGPP